MNPIERQALSLLVHQPELAGPYVVGSVMATPLAREVLDRLLGHGLDVAAVLNDPDLDETVASAVAQVAVEEPEDEPYPSLMLVVTEAARRVAAELEAAVRADVSLWESHSRASTWLRQETDRVRGLWDTRHATVEDLEALVTWLAEREQEVISLDDEPVGEPLPSGTDVDLREGAIADG